MCILIPAGPTVRRIFLAGGVTINNDIYLDTIRAAAGANAGIQVGNFTTSGTTVTVNNDASATVNGTIRVAAPATAGGTFVGAMPTTNSQNYTAATTTNFLTLNGPVIFTTAGTSPKSAAGAAGNIIQQRAGNIRWGGGGSYYRIELRNGVGTACANNGLATNSYIEMGGNANVNPANYSIFDLNGFNQTMVGLSNYITAGNPATVSNTSTTAPATLTLVPANPTSNPNQANLWLTAGGGAAGAVSTQSAALINVSPNAPLNLVINGDAAGTQYITTPANAYTGTTTLTSGTLAVSSLGDGGATANLITTMGSPTATVDTTTGLAVGQLVISPNVRTYVLQGVGGASTTITAIDPTSNTITLSANATAGDGVTATPAAFGAGNGLGISSSAATNLIFNGGALSYVRGVPGTATTDGNPVNFTGTSATPSMNRNFTINAAKSGTIDVENGTGATATTVLTMSGGSANTTGNLIKSGPGTLVLTGTNLHKGGTTVSAGTLLVSGTGSLSTGTVSIASGALLGGNGTIGGTVVPASGGIVSPGNGAVGTMTVGGLTLNTGSISNFEFNATPANDQITVNGAGGLAINGGGINLYQEGTTTAFSTNGTYTLFNINGGLTGALTNLTISNPTAGKFYSLANSPASGVQLTIGTATTINWNGNTSTSWSTGGNWVGGVSPNVVGTSVRFNSANLTGSSNTTVAVDGGGKTTSGIIFNDDSSSNAFTISGSTLTLNNGVAAAAISVGGGSQTISVPISSASALSVSLANSSSLTISGAY